jgi:hypothetical protein
VKEIHYFDRPPDWRDPVRRYVDSDEDTGRSRGTSWDRRYDRRPRDDDWYGSLFEPAAGQICGEITPGYAALDAAAVGRVRALLPRARILFLMRNPIERTWSQTIMYLHRYGIPLADVGGRRLRELFRLDRVRRVSDYTGAIDRWAGAYSSDALFVGFLEDVALDPRALLRRICTFLGVSGDFEAPFAEARVYRHAGDRIPVAAARSLARENVDQIRELDRRFGGYASFWRYCAYRLLGGGLDDRRSLGFPLSRSSLWTEWIEGRGEPGVPTLQSAPLADLSPLAL